jgi:hypothetical protein
MLNQNQLSRVRETPQGCTTTYTNACFGCDSCTECQTCEGGNVSYGDGTGVWYTPPTGPSICVSNASGSGP